MKSIKGAQGAAKRPWSGCYGGEAAGGRLGTSGLLGKAPPTDQPPHSIPPRAPGRRAHAHPAPGPTCFSSPVPIVLAVPPVPPSPTSALSQRPPGLAAGPGRGRASGRPRPNGAAGARSSPPPPQPQPSSRLAGPGPVLPGPVRVPRVRSEAGEGGESVTYRGPRGRAWPLPPRRSRRFLLPSADKMAAAGSAPAPPAPPRPTARTLRTGPPTA